MSSPVNPVNPSADQPGPPDQPNLPNQPSLPDLSDLIGESSRPPRRTLPPRVLLLGLAVLGALVLAGAGFFAGRASASSGPSTLAEAVQQASAGKLPCGSTDGAGGQFLTALCSGRGAGGRFGAGGTGQNGTGQNGAGQNGARLGGLFGPGSVTGTITSVSGTTMQVQTRAGTITVTLPATTEITASAPGSSKDLTAGKTVVINTTTGDDGTQTAQRVYVLPQAN